MLDSRVMSSVWTSHPSSFANLSQTLELWVSSSRSGLKFDLLSRYIENSSTGKSTTLGMDLKKQIDPQPLGSTSFMLNSISARSGINNPPRCIPCKWNGILSYGYWNQDLSWKYFVVLDRSIGGIRRLMCSPQIRFRQPSHSSNSTLLSELHLFNYHLPKWSCLLF